MDLNEMEEKGKEMLNKGENTVEEAKEKATELGHTAEEKLHLGHKDQEVDTAEEEEQVL